MQEIIDFLEKESEETPTPDEGLAEWKRQKSEARARMIAMQNQPYEVKVKRAELRAIEFIGEMDKRGLNAHVSVGGLDSITLFVFLKSIGIHVPAISVFADSGGTSKGESSGVMCGRENTKHED